MFTGVVFLLFVSGLVNGGSTRQGDLSGAGHHADMDVHDVGYDQEAFLGRDEAEKYKEMSVEESKARLRALVDTRVDTDKNGLITTEELKTWIKYISTKWISDERNRSWKEYNPANKSTLTFEDYATLNYGDRREERYRGEDLKRVLNEIELDKQKWQFADDNSDGLLDKEEFMAFVRPEEVPKMKPFLIDEMLSRTDKNKDGYIDLEEYTEELYIREPNIVRGRYPEPQWITSELKHFNIHHDRNNDKKMDRKEIGEWISPEGYDGVEAETHHLITHADTNKDGVLSIDEIVEHNDLFAGSQATNYGATLKNKEEL